MQEFRFCLAIVDLLNFLWENEVNFDEIHSFFKRWSITLCEWVLFNTEWVISWQAHSI